MKKHVEPAPLEMGRSAAIMFTDGKSPGTFTLDLFYDGKGVPDHKIGDPESPTHLAALKAYKMVKAALDQSMNPLNADGTPMEQTGESEIDRLANVMEPPRLVQ